MKRFFFVFSTLSFIIVAINLSVLSIEFDSSNKMAQTSSNSCPITLQLSRRVIEKGRNISIVKVENLDISRTYSEYPFGRSQGYLLVLKGTAAAAILTSPQLLKSISANIIQSCKSVSSVQFVQSNTDFFRTFGLLGNSVKEFKCQNFSISDLRAGRQRPPLAWGEEVCL